MNRRRNALQHTASGTAAALLRLLAYGGGFLGLGALAAFPVHVALGGAAAVEFDSVLQRVVALAALVLLPLYLAGGFGSGTALGIARPRRTVVISLLRGFALGTAAVLPLLAAFAALGIRTWSLPPGATAPGIVVHAALALAAAAVIGIVEETFFRGVLLAPFRRTPAWLAAGVVSVVYAVLHFVGGPVVAAEAGWRSGFASVARSEVPLDAFLALFAAGLLLGALRYRVGHIWLGAGFHAGWVWLMKLNQDYADLDAANPLALLAGEYGGTMGYLGLLWIAVLGSAWYAYDRKAAAV